MTRPTYRLAGWLAIAVWAACAAESALAVDPGRCGLLRGCPDDHCRKPLPCVPRLQTCCPDDYCPKPLPCFTHPKLCGPGAYCRKPLPCISWEPTPGVLYGCGPNTAGCRGVAAAPLTPAAAGSTATSASAR